MLFRKNKPNEIYLNREIYEKDNKYTVKYNKEKIVYDSKKEAIDAIEAEVYLELKSKIDEICNRYSTTFFAPERGYEHNLELILDKHSFYIKDHCENLFYGSENMADMLREIQKVIHSTIGYDYRLELHPRDTVEIIHK